MYSTYGISYFHNAENLNSNFGLIINHDRQYNAVITSTSLGLNYSYMLKTGYNSKVLFGINGNYLFYSANYGRLIFENPGVEFSENQQSRSPVINSGISFLAGRKHLIGISATNIFNQINTNNFTREFHLSYIGEIITRRQGLPPLSIEPVGKISLKKDFINSSYGCNIRFSAFKTGILITQSNLNINTSTFLLGILFENFEFIYTYDLNLSGAISINPKMAAHEVTFLNKIQYKGKRKKHRAIKCPEL